MLVHRLASLEFNKNYSLGRRLLHSIRTYKEDKRWPGWEVIVGIEVHAQIKSRRKLFSGYTRPLPLTNPSLTRSI